MTKQEYTAFMRKQYGRILEGENAEEGGENKSAETVTLILKKGPNGKPEYFDQKGQKFLTQDQVNYEVGTARAKAGEKNKELIDQLREVQEKASTSEQMKQELEEQIKVLQTQSMTKEEQLLAELKTNQSKWEKEKEKLSKEHQEAVALWTEERIGNEIRDACSSNKAVSHEQIYGLIRAKTQLVPQHDDTGKPTGKYEAVVALDDVDDSGNPVIKKLPVDKAVARMREMTKRFGNLFLHGEESGVGKQTMYGHESLSMKSDVPPPEAFKSMEAYDKWAKANLK